MSNKAPERTNADEKRDVFRKELIPSGIWSQRKGKDSLSILAEGIAELEKYLTLKSKNTNSILFKTNLIERRLYSNKLTKAERAFVDKLTYADRLGNGTAKELLALFKEKNIEAMKQKVEEFKMANGLVHSKSLPDITLAHN